MSVGHWPSIMRTPSLSANRQSVASAQLIRNPSKSRKYWALLSISGTASTKAQGTIFDRMATPFRLNNQSKTLTAFLMRDQAMSQLGQSRRWTVGRQTSDPPLPMDIISQAWEVRLVPLASTLNSTAAPIPLRPPCEPPAPALSKSSSPRCVPTPRRRSFDWGFSSGPAQTPRPRTPGCRSPADCGV